MFKANTADGKAVIADSTGFSILDSANGEFTYQVPNALSAVPGKITTAYFSFSDSSGSESTFDVVFVIKKAVDATQAQADDYITIIDGTLQTLQQKIDAMSTDVQTILDAFNQGDFYSQTQTDDKDAATLTSAQSYADTAGYVAPQTATTVQVQQLSTSPIEFWREGHTVFLQGAGKFPASYSGSIWTIPLGFSPSKEQMISILAQNSAFSALILWFKPSGETTITFCSDNSTMWLAGISWHTNDPMPS